ncbi:protein ACCELERATED CELL DEATH 6-like isoform X1 [Syzygium oleosum]|uniref:protein ACCELERATED CELL DEATH 6-like isoform X1 n=1 Tax=Syzygium oleosum TaxID=219896 RepID=UPI0024B982C1|nr:protein ACCELERATED CELL DEATH 6-like isoform X1 [Syzygium oleosum]
MQIFWLLLEGYARDEDYAIKIQGMSPVLAACKEWEWKPGILEEIIDRLPKLLHVRDENGGTPLHSAALAGNWMAVTVLLRACPYLALQTDKDGSYPIHIACEGGDCVTISALIDDTWSDLAEIKNNKGQNILHVAAKAGNNEAVRYILGECRELVKLKDVDGNTPLHLASRHNHCEVLRSLVSEKRSDLELMNNDKLTALDVAMEPQSFSSKDPAVQGRNILIKARVPRSKDRDVRSPREQSSKASKPSRAKWIKAEMDTQLLVATLVASVTFTAGVTLPGGYNASDDRHPGMATTLHKGVFQLFVICDALAMYNSILAVVVLLGGNGSDIRIAKRAYTIAGSLLLWAFISMAVAFLAAIIVAVSKLIWLMTLVLCIAVLYIGILLGYYYPLIGPRGKVYR